MKGLIALFLAIVFVGIGWRFVDRPTKNSIKKWIGGNIFIVAIALFAVALAIALSANTTMRFL
jgi:hypothetical protein